jgi:hypothetical protein
LIYALAFWGASFLLEHSCLRFRDFDLAPSFFGAFVPSRTLLLFWGFRSFWNALVYASAVLTLPLALCGVRVVLRSQWAILELDLPMALDVLAFGLSNANLILLDILTCA